MSKYNLHHIFSYLVDDDKFLATVIDTDKDIIKIKKKDKPSSNFLADITISYSQLVPYEKQLYKAFPNKLKSLLTSDYIRYGIKNTITKNLNTINITFLNSFNMILRPELTDMVLDDQIKNVNLLETFLCHTLDRNHHIDKIKRTGKSRAVNNELIKNLTEGKITHELIQRIINIFEINLMVFDLTNLTAIFYWAKGVTYPSLNLFNNVYCMTFIQGNYEPLIRSTYANNTAHKKKIYDKIFSNLADVKFIPDIEIGLHVMIHLDSDITSTNTFTKCAELSFATVKRNIHKSLTSFTNNENECLKRINKV